MAKSYMTSDDLIKSVIRRAGLPKVQATFTDEDFLAFANEEMDTGLVPSVLSAREDYFMVTDEVELHQNIVRYDIPARAIGNKLRDVSYLSNNMVVSEMTRIPIDYLPDYNAAYTYGRRAFTYYIENNQVVLVALNGENVTPGKLRFTYYMRPNRLVLLNQVGIIQNIDRITGQLVLSNIPQDFSVQQKFDFISTISPHRTLAKDLRPTGLDPLTKTITFDPLTFTDKLQVGDHVSIAETSAIPQFPSDIQVVLAHRTAARCLEALGDQEGLQAANVKLAELEQKTQIVIDDRVEAAPEKVINRFGSVRRGRNSRRFRYWR